MLGISVLDGEAPAVVKPPIPVDEERRMAALRAMGILNTPAEERFDRITRLATRFLNTPIALVSLVGDDFQWFKSAQGLPATEETSRDVSFCAHAINGDDAMVVEDAARDERFSDNPLVTGDPHVRFYAGQPLHAGDGSRVGTLCVIDSVPRTFSGEERLVLRDLAALVEAEFQRGTLSAIQTELLSERDELQRKASIDGLTRVWNRGAILDILDREIARGKRGMPVSVAMIDVDHFKQINDTYGHPTGDGVLVEVAARIRNTVRDIDSVGRYGGEEFLAVFSNCVPSKAADVAERIRRRVGGTPFRTPAGSRTVTVSIGVAGSPPAEGNAALIGAADAALYRAKQAGRDRIELTDE